MATVEKKAKYVIPPEVLEKAKRTVSARKFAGLSREVLGTRYNIPLSTLRAWETSGKVKTVRGLTLRGAQKLVRALQEEGVSCSVEWLMDGHGIGPRFIHSDQTNSDEINNKQFSPWEQQLSIQKEITFFEENNANSIVVMVSDDGLEPLYSIGEYVGGTKAYLKDIDMLINKYCIIETSEKELLIRKLLPGKKPKTYSLFCINPNTTSYNPVKYDVQLNWAAQIVWHRKQSE